MATGSSSLEQINLVSSRPEDDAQLLDPAFINAWGIAIRPAGLGGHWWVANTDTSRVTLYVGDSETVEFTQDGLSVLGVPGAAGPDIEVTIDPPTEDGVPLAAPSPAPATVMPPSNPTGQVYSGSNTDFLVDGTSLTGATLVDTPARFITVSEDGTIAAWGEFGSSPAQRMNAFAVVVDNSATGAIYKGVTVSSDSGSGNFLYAANFSQGRIDVFDAAWAPMVSAGFVPVGPGGRDAAEFSPFNIERVYDSGRGEDVLIATYAKIGDAAAGEEQATDGFIAKYTLNGTFLAASDAGGLFNAPWGVALADESFGAYGGMLLVGNFGDGRILALDIDSLEPEGYLLDGLGEPVFIDGLWDLIVGNGASLGHNDRVYFSAGPDEEAEGLFGSLSVGTDIDAAEFFTGSSGEDARSGASSDDVLRGRAGDDTLLGQNGDDFLRGGDGRDALFGGADDDRVIGDSGDDRLVGGRGDDILNGGDGDDDLAGGSGADMLIGGAGADAMSGGLGDDHFSVDDVGDVVYEEAGSGIDKIKTSVDYTLGAGQEIEWLIARSDALGLQLTGNELDNNLVGRDGADTLDGGDGNDRLRGGSGDDTLEGGDGDDRLTGGSGNDMLEGGAGRDRLRGDDGDDTFAFSNLAETGTTGATRDTILDFVQGEDLIDLSALDGVTGGADDAFAFIGDATFSGAAGELRWSEVGANTLLQGDVNGDAVVDFTVLLAGSHVLQGSDFLL